MINIIVFLCCYFAYTNGYEENFVGSFENSIQNSIDAEIDTNLYNELAKAGRSMERDVNFLLYTRKGPSSGVHLEKTMKSLKSSTFDPERITKFITHGFLSDGYSDTCQEIKDQYLKFYDDNVIVVDWGKLARNPMYFIPAIQTRQVGEYYAAFLDFLVENGADPLKMHLIGHSLGAHVSGFAGMYAKHKIGRVTGLDPALPSFEIILLAKGRLSTQSALFVDVIHTSAGTLGLSSTVGHADFYPNGGTMPQPGCNGITEVVQACSHGRSWQFFKASIDPSVKFASHRCTKDEFEKDQCISIDVQYMGEHVSVMAKGTYYLRTTDSPPYAINDSNK